MKILLSRIKLSVLSGLSEVGSLSIAIVFFIILTLVTLAVVSYLLMNSEIRMSVNFVQRLQAQYLAEAGTEYGISLIFQGQGGPYTETVSAGGGYFSLSIEQDSVLTLTSTGDIDRAEKAVEVKMNYYPPIADFAIFSTDDIDNVTALDEAGDPDPSLMIANAPFLPDMDDSTLIALATAQGHVETGGMFIPSHGYPNFNFYFSGTVPNVTWVQNNLKVLGGRTVYGIFVVDGNISLDGSSRVEGVLYMRDSVAVVAHGGGNPTESIITGGIVAAGAINGTGNHITVQYNSEYMGKFGEHEQSRTVSRVFSWREL
ncbi:hypothetical protein IH970_07630 [candidate division KSB1 bacterium]|nr:hypothetical protein [candidate division KSB1 bacterium]